MANFDFSSTSDEVAIQPNACEHVLFTIFHVTNLLQILCVGRIRPSRPYSSYSSNTPLEHLTMSSKLQSVLSIIAAGERPTKVDLSNCGLSEFPRELLELADCLEVLNMGGNHLTTLPQDISAFTKLRILFFAGNDFETIPEELGSIKTLFMLSFKSNKLKAVPYNSLSPSIYWLILTDNAIEGISFCRCFHSFVSVSPIQ